MSYSPLELIGELPDSHPLLRDSDFKHKYKTELCNNWATGFCPYGDYCAFAHGTEELRKKVTTSEHYKTKKCKQFFETGCCGYGPRCQFIHMEKRRLPVFRMLSAGRSQVSSC